MPSQTPKGLPFPLPTEPIADGATAIRLLAEAVDPLVGSAVGAELAYFERTVAHNLQMGVYETSLGPVTFTADAGVDYWVEAFWPSYSNLNGNGYYIEFVLDGVVSGRVNWAALSAGPAVLIRRRLVGLAAGDHTIAFQAETAGGGGGVLYAGDSVGPNHPPASLRVTVA
jgi:hypothetical protein